MTRFVRPLVCTVALAWALAAAGCNSSPAGHAAANRLCTPGANVFCNCVGGKETGTKLCLASGQAFGPCEPCTVPLTETDTGRSTREDTSGEGPDTQVGDNADNCPGSASKLSSSQDLTVYGDTTTLSPNLSGSGTCQAGSAAKDAVYELTATDRGKITITLKPESGFDGMIYVRRGKCDATQIACGDAAPAGGTETVQVFAEAGEKLYVIVDGKGGSAGGFSLVVKQLPGTFCGDNTLNPDENCEDGNQVSGDGCSEACKPEAKSSIANLCPGLPVHVWSAPVELVGSSAASSNANKSTCGGSGAREVIYAVIAHRTGILHATIKQADFDVVMYARNEPCLTGAESGCGSLVKGNGGEKMAIPVKTGATTYVFIDGFKYANGDFTLGLLIE